MSEKEAKLYEERVYIRNNEAKCYTPDHLIKIIEDAEEELAKLKGTTFKSTYIGHKIKELEAQLVKVIAELDSRVS